MIEIEGAVVALGRLGSEEAKLGAEALGLGVFTGEEQDQGVVHHGRLDLLQKLVSAEEGVDVAGSGQDGDSHPRFRHLLRQSWDHHPTGIGEIRH